ncbi:hypothetical protein PoMZ_09119, partial [Pyricularia oryzae]
VEKNYICSKVCDPTWASIFPSNSASVDAPSEWSVIISSSPLIVKKPPDPNSTLVQKQKQKQWGCRRTQYRTRTRIDARGVPQRGSKGR